MAPAIVVADTSVLVNFLRIDRIDLIGRHPDSFVVTDHVAAEITDPEQTRRYATALAVGHLVEQRVDNPLEVEMFLRLSQGGRLGAGERSAIAVAINRSYRLAIEDNRAIRHALQEAGISGNPVSIVRTQDVVLELIRARTLTVEMADAMLLDWANNHRFKLRFSSFRDLLKRD